MSDNDNNVNIVVTATDKASQTFLALSKNISMITGSIANVTKGYIAYGDQVKKLSLFIGTNNEETSRLIQVADDAFIEFETLRMAAKNLSQKGFEPNIETMAKLSDEFLKLSPGLARSQWLVERFGRSGMEMAKMLELGGDKIREMNAGVEAGLIIDDKRAANILKTKQALDTFNDSVDAMKYEFAEKLLNTFNEMDPALQKLVLTFGAVGQSGLLNQLAMFSILAGNIAKMNWGGIGTAMGGAASTAGTAFAGLAASLGVSVVVLGGFVAAIAALIAALVIFGPKAANTLHDLGAILAGTIILAAYNWKINLDKIKLYFVDTFTNIGNFFNTIGQGIINMATKIRDIIIQLINSGKMALGLVPGILSQQSGQPGLAGGSNSIIPARSISSNSQVTVNYNAGFGLANREETVRNLTPLVREAMRGA